jgi:hypothetical protein
VVREGVLHLGGVARDEHLSAVEHRAAPRRAPLHLAAADGISGRVAAIDALDFVGSLVHAHQCEEAMADHLLYEGVDRGVK